MSEKQSLNVKLVGPIAAVVLVVLCGGFLGVRWYAKRVQTRRMQVACVAVALPFVALEHNKSTIESMMADLGNKKDDGLSEPAPSPSERVVLSKDIDARLLDISARMQKMAQANESPSYEKFSGDFEALSGLFLLEARPYMTDCLALFKQMSDTCGDLNGTNSKDSSCQGQFKDSFKQLMAKHISPIAAEAAPSDESQKSDSADDEDAEDDGD